MEQEQINMEPNGYQERIPVTRVTEMMDRVKEAIGAIIIGQNEMVELLMTALLADGHVLLEGVPGVAKTLTAKTLAALIAVDFSRIQFTPDLMPSDVIGTNIFNPKEGGFEFKKGPIFGNIVLIDEINRSPAKTQAALFEVMEERQITSDGFTHKMEAPFMVVATQNPIEHEGTYRLPEAQLDRFLFKININYPSLEEELQILNLHHKKSALNFLDNIQTVIDKKDIDFCRSVISQVIVEEKLLIYITQIIHDTRNNPSLYLGASPRASIALLNASKSLAVLRGRDFVTPEDIKDNVMPALRHRVALTPEKEMDGLTTDSVLKEIIDRIEIPR
ncbi:MAG TPA: MoxR family ATPase [Edaphocola sp.]|nr:MoxR family ATPase [Edaphocola sp.]